MSWLGLFVGLLLVLPPTLSTGVARTARAPYRFALGLLLLLLWATAPARAAEPGIRVPESAAMYRRMVEQAASDYLGVHGSSARLAAQVHQESLWRPKVKSFAGAMGLAQFMPATAEWIAEVFPRELGQFDPWDPAQAIRGAALYDRWLHERVQGAGPCDRWAFVLSAYNGGLGWVNRDKVRARQAGADPLRWFGHVELHADPRRAPRNVRENRGYVSRILTVLEPLYVSAGWPGGPAVCA